MPASTDVVRVFDHDPDLLAGLDDRTAALLRRRFVARRLHAEPGTWHYEVSGQDAAAHFGLLVLDGLVVRTVALGHRECAEVVGPGDLIRPWDAEEPLWSVSSDSAWRVLVPTTFAELDAAFARHVASCPSIAAQLLSRSTRRCRGLVHQAVIARVRHASTRVLLALWHLADRWGKVTPRGVLVPVPLTHQLLARITCLERPTVSAAVRRLELSGLISREPDGGWLLHGEPPDPVTDSERLTVA